MINMIFKMILVIVLCIICTLLIYSTIVVIMDNYRKRRFTKEILNKFENKALTPVKFYLDENGIMPRKAHKTDAGFDIFAPNEFVVRAHSSVFIDSCVRVILPKGTCGMIKSKSGLNRYYDLLTEGVIDQDYTGTIGIKIYNHGDEDFTFEKGDKVTQLVVMPITNCYAIETKQMPTTERGNNGFGSTGR